jgi:hypothetical protein
MPRNVTVILGDKPGELARLGTVMGDASVNIKGLAAFTGDGHGVIHLLIDDADAERALAALKTEKIGVADDREVIVVDIVDRPGTLGELTLELAEANVNIDLAYATFGDTQLVIATDDMESARAALA